VRGTINKDYYMKNIILLLAMCLLVKASFANVTHATMDDDLEFKLETDSRESERGVAAFDEDKENKKEVVIDKDAAEEIETTESQKERDVASDEEIFDTTNENGIKYWKY
jgi:hypothetical protein